MMDLQLIDVSLIKELQKQAQISERRRQSFDLRTTTDDNSQRLLNVLEPGTHVAIHRHLRTAETGLCLEGCLDWVFYEEMPNMDAGGPIHDGERALDETCFKEIGRIRACPRERKYGVQIPPRTWHTVEVHEPSTIFEAKDGKYGE